jgi:hypothetical protein
VLDIEGMTIKEIPVMDGEKSDYDIHLESKYARPFLEKLKSMKTRRWWNFKKPDFDTTLYESCPMDFICRNPNDPLAVEIEMELSRVLGYHPDILRFPFFYR